MVDHNRDFWCGIIGIAGGVSCAIGDILFDYLGPGNETIGTYGIIESNWLIMPEWRFTASILLASIGVILYFWGLVAMKNQLSEKSQKAANVFWWSASAGSLGGIFIHASICYMPIIYKTIVPVTNAELAEQVINKIYKAIEIPFFFLYTCLVVIPSIVIVIAILKKQLYVPQWFIVLNPLVFLIIGMCFRLINPVLFADLPGIVMPSLGLGAIGFSAAISAKRNLKQTST